MTPFATNGLVLDSPVKSRELDLMIFMGAFQREIFCDSMILCGKGVTRLTDEEGHAEKMEDITVENKV